VLAQELRLKEKAAASWSRGDRGGCQGEATRAPAGARGRGVAGDSEDAVAAVSRPAAGRRGRPAGVEAVVGRRGRKGGEKRKMASGLGGVFFH
jgi:hypothetical protein